MHRPRIGIAQVPNKPVHPAVSRAAADARSNYAATNGVSSALSHRRAGKNSVPVFRPRRKFPAECLRRNSRGKKLIQYRAVRRILPRGSFPGGSGVSLILGVGGGRGRRSRRKYKRAPENACPSRLPERRDVIQYPKRTP